MAARPWRPVWLLAICLLAPMPAAAQCGDCPGATLPAWICAHEVKIDGTGCTTFKDCVPPEVAGTRIDVLDMGGGTYEARLVVDVKAPRTSSNPYSFMKLKLYWSQGSVAGPSSSMCQLTMWDRTDTWLAYGGLTCAGAPYDFGTFSLYAVVCEGGGSCQYAVPVEGLSFQVTKQTLGCPEPPRWGCGGDAGCRECISVGPGTASPAGEGASASPPLSGPGAMLRYRAGGAGHPSWPGAAAWNQALGRYWSHDYAERLVQDPDASHVWLLTRYATFREFTDADADGLYETVSPSDEQRELVKVAAGWELRGLDGSVQHFDAGGLWTRTVDRNGNEKAAVYSGGVLTRVTFPDGRREDFAYHADGKLQSITEVGVDGTTSRAWTYTWSGHDLTRIDRPDGTALEFFYSADPNLGGYLTRIDLRGSGGGTGRVESAWEYDSQGNVTKTWRGDPVFSGPNAVDLHLFSYDNAALPKQTVVTDPLGRPSTYSVGRDPVSRKPRMSRIQGDCPSCGLGPETTFEYGDPANPLLPTAMVDAKGHRTEMIYNADGLLIERTEAAGTALSRTTAWEYDPVFRAFPTRIDRPSVAGGLALRSTVMTYDAEGNLLTRTEQGQEDGSAFALTTSMTYNAAGQVLTLDPPGHGTADVTTFTYDAARGGLLPLSRTDPLVGTTTYSYDPFNRRTGVTDIQPERDLHLRHARHLLPRPPHRHHPPWRDGGL